MAKESALKRLLDQLEEKLSKETDEQKKAEVLAKVEELKQKLGLE